MKVNKLDNDNLKIKCKGNKYTVNVRNRFKGLDLIDRMPDELWNEFRDIVQETGNKNIPMEKKCKKGKWGGLTNGCEKKRSEKQRRKGNM